MVRPCHRRKTSVKLSEYVGTFLPKKGLEWSKTLMLMMLLSGVGQQDLADREELYVLPGDGGEGGHSGALLSQGCLRRAES